MLELLGTWRQEELKFRVCLGYRATSGAILVNMARDYLKLFKKLKNFKRIVNIAQRQNACLVTLCLSLFLAHSPSLPSPLSEIIKDIQEGWRKGPRLESGEKTTKVLSPTLAFFLYRGKVPSCTDEIAYKQLQMLLQLCYPKVQKKIPPAPAKSKQCCSAGAGK